jgi:hypothetical protein
MANRFIDTNFYKSPFIRSLKGASKGLYSFIICDCNNAGIWSADFEIASLYIDFKVTVKDFDVFLKSGKAIDLKNGKFFFPDFIEHQYPQGLNESNPAHKNVIFELKKYNLIDGALKVLRSTFEGTKDMDMEKGKVMDTDMVKDNDPPKTEKSDLEKAFDSFLEMRRKIKKPATDRAVELLKIKIKKLSNNNQELAIEIINQSILNSWQDFYPLKQNDTNNKPLGRGTVQQAADLLESARNGKSIEELRDTPGLL